MARSYIYNEPDKNCPFFVKFYGNKIFVLFLGFRPLWSAVIFHFLNPIFLFIFKKRTKIFVHF